MSNGSNIRKTKAASKYFIVDYRNAKYQGEISEYKRLPNGMGMLMSINYQLIVANWEEGTINGQCMCVYPEGNIFYGTIRNNQLTGFSTYQVSKKKYIYSIITKEPHCWFFIDFQITNTLLALRVPTQEVNQLLSNQHYSLKRSQQVLVSYIDSSLKKKNEIAQEYLYQNQEDKWNNVAKLTGKTISNQNKNIKAFLKYHFNVHAPNRDCRLEITQTSEFTELRYRKAGIVCRLDENEASQHQVKFLGYYDSYEEHSDVYRKTTSSLDGEIQQYCEGHALTYTKERPQVCKKNLQNHFRKSVHFVNHFICLQVIGGVLNLCSSIFLSVEDEMSTKYAQIQLQKGVEQKPAGEKDEVQVRQPMTEKFKKIELNDIKNDIYNKVKKRKNSPSIDKEASFTSKPFERSTVSNYNFRKQLKENYENLRGYERRYLDQPTPKRTMEYLRYTEESPVGKIRYSKSNKRQDSNQHHAKRKYSYIPPEESQFDDFKADRVLQKSVSNTFLDNNKYTNGYVEQREENYYNLRKQNKQRVLNPHIESISSLANNYERIKVQLSQEKKLNSKREQERAVSPSYNAGTPSNRSPSRISHLKYQVHSPNGTGGRRRQWR